MQNVIETVLSPTSRLIEPPKSIVVIGANTGGPQALSQTLPCFPAGFAGTIIVIQQMRPGFTRVLADQLSSICQLPAYEPIDGQALQKSTILIVPSGHSIAINRVDPSGYEIDIDDVRNDSEVYPKRISHAMTSAAKAFGDRAIGVMLTGLGDDGVDGMRAISQAGGIAIAQDASTSVAFDMPSRSIDAGAATDVLPLWNIADRIIQGVMGELNADAA